ncbi:MAG: 2-hydroxyacyl-CoA dehydratase family protein, partial [Chloroflexota bacterium]|nr:2-hydroxyacyl-CoA dehydratase family protein [Chloroflexota bacterium]
MTQAQESPRTQKTTAVKATDTAKEIPGVIKGFYARAQERARAGDPVAYCMVNTIPQEILLAMGIVGMYTEHYATVCAAKHANMAFLERAEGDGYPTYTCSYARNWLGYAGAAEEMGGEIPEGSPWGGMPRPNMILGRTSCDAGYKGYQAMARYYQVPT